MQGLQKTVHADTKFYSLPGTDPNTVWLYNLPAGVKIRPAQDGYERDGYAHVYDPASREGWIAIPDLTPYEDSVRTPTPTPTPTPKPNAPAAPTASMTLPSAGVDWGTVAKVGGVAIGVLALLGGVMFLKKRMGRRHGARENPVRRRRNPLRRGSSRETISYNIRKLKREHPDWAHKRVIAAALNNARRTGNYPARRAV